MGVRTTGERWTLGVACDEGTEISSHPGTHLCPLLKTPMWGVKEQKAKTSWCTRTCEKTER